MVTKITFLSLLLWQILSSTSYASNPHVLFIVVDDLGYTDTGYHGAEFNTSNIDSLALSGIDLTNYYVQLSCTPTRASLMTGRYPWRIGLQNPWTMMAGSLGHIPFDTPTIAEQLKLAGYNTQMIGKWHLGFAAKNMTPTGRGFNDHIGFYNGAEHYYSHQDNNGYDFEQNNVPQQQLNGTYSSDVFFGHFFDYLSKYYNKSNANDYIDKPLFMYLALQTIHCPIEAPPMKNINGRDMTDLYDKECGHIDNTERMTYCEKLQYVDVYIGELIDLYKKLNLWHNTLLILTTDNGGMPKWNASGNLNGTFTKSYGQNYPLRGGKATLFEGGVLGLSYISGPLIPTQLIGTTNDNLFGAIDWFPSILSFIGSDNLIPNNLDGKNIMYSLFNNTDFNRNQIVLFSNFDYVEDYTVGSLIGGGIINGEWKYIYGNQPYNCYYPHPPDPIICLTNETVTDKYLFNIKNDPLEANNVVEQYPNIARNLAELIVEDAINNGWEYNETPIQWNASCPQWHDGNWVPWLETAPMNDVVVICANLYFDLQHAN